MNAQTKRQGRRPKSGNVAAPNTAPSQPPPFAPATFLAKVGAGRTLVDYPKDKIIFAQGDTADAVFYLRKGKVKLTVVSSQGKEAVVAILDQDAFFGEGCLIAQPQRMATATALTSCSGSSPK